MNPAQERQAAAYDDRQVRDPALRLVLAYAVFAALWILVSDEAVILQFRDARELHLANTLKGWLFVAITSVLLFALVRRLLRQMLLASQRELAARQQRVEALQLLAAIADNSTDAIFAKDGAGRYLLFNREAARVTGVSEAEILGRDDTAAFPPQQAAMIRANDRRVLAENAVITGEETLSTVDGERVYLATKGPLRGADGELIGLFGISRDITGRHHAEVELRRSLEELERFNRLAVGRELDMVHLKRQVNALAQRLGEAPPYALGFEESAAAGGKLPT